MLDRTDDISIATENWLAQFETALTTPDDVLLKTLFHPDSYWRDVLALGWNIQTLNGADAILTELKAQAGRARPAGFAIDPDRAAPRKVMRAGTNAIEAIFKFETAQGRGNGILRLVPDAGDSNTIKAWTLLTALDELKGFEEQLGISRPRGEAYSRDFRGPNWLDLRKAAAEYGDRDPAVVVVGGGQSGLCIAARLKQLQVDTLIVDREARIGDNWRNRYHALTLHNQVQVNHLPYMPFPPNWPTSIPLALARKSHAMVTEHSKRLDQELLDGLVCAGFKLDFGDGNTGWQFKYLTRGGGYYFNVGCSDLIVKGEIALKQFSDIEGFVADGARMKSGETLAADLIVLATGYKRQEELVRKLFGEEVVDRIGPIWGFGETQELRNMYTRTRQPGLWLIAGGLAQCRINSKYLALQIKAVEEGLLPRVRENRH